MNIKKINKIDKLIINNKEILNIKYKERNDFLENNCNKPQEDIINDLEKIDKYIDEIEEENKKLVKELEKLKKVENVDLDDNLIKTQLCKYYKSSKGCDKGPNCSFAHNENELRCIFDQSCINEECKRIHIKRDIKPITKNNKEIAIIDEEEKKPEIQLTINGNKYYDDNYINKNLENKKNIKNESSRDNIEYNNYNKFYEVESININTNQVISDKTLELVNNLQEEFNKYIKDIKRNIDESFLDDKKQYGTNLKIDLNKISSELNLFKNNFKDITFRRIK